MWIIFAHVKQRFSIAYMDVVDGYVKAMITSSCNKSRTSGRETTQGDIPCVRGCTISLSLYKVGPC